MSIIKSTGKKAKDLRELKEIIAFISDESLFLHTYQIRDYLSLWYVMENPGRNILEL